MESKDPYWSLSLKDDTTRNFLSVWQSSSNSWQTLADPATVQKNRIQTNTMQFRVSPHLSGSRDIG